MDYTEDQLVRYARHIILPEVGGKGQEKLLKASVLVVGAGGLGAPILMYLAAAGVGTIGVVDDDVVDLSNLQRQVIHTTDRIGSPKVLSARKTLRNLNPDPKIVTHETRLDSSNVESLFSEYDVIADGSDNFATRFLIADAAHLIGRTLVSAAILRFEGQLSTFKSHLGRDNPCYRCLFSKPPPEGTVPSCSEGGVFGALAGVMGALQATEVLKEIIGGGETLSGNLLLFDALSTTFRKIRMPSDPSCALCGVNPTIKDLCKHAID
jgi:molybdopterin/thiamine biosynthesis adenylyltransferase